MTSVLEDADTAAVVIATRHDSHSRLAAAALRAGKHVYLEKPLALDRTELEQALAAAAASDRLLVIGYNRRFAPLALRLKRELASCKGPIAIVYRVNAGAIPSDHWTRDRQIGGGRIVGEACHFVPVPRRGNHLTRFVRRIGGSDKKHPVQRESLSCLLSQDQVAAVYRVECSAHYADGSQICLLRKQLRAESGKWRAQNHSGSSSHFQFIVVKPKASCAIPSKTEVRG